jgi:hypothetical protein
MNDPNTIALNILANIPDGAKLLMWRQRPDKSCVVLCAWRDEYVTWVFYPHSEGGTQRRYARELSDAVDTFKARLTG